MSSDDWPHRYAQMGWRVLPVRGKKPILKGWPDKATTDPDIFSSWFSSGENIGIATGEKSGIVVLDIDPRNGGDLSLKRLEREVCPLPPTVKAKTGGGGSHLIFNYFDGARSRTPVDGIDFLSDGKMFVASPSVHPQTGVIYEWDRTPFDGEPAGLPEEWKRFLTNPASLVVSNAEPILEGSRNSALFEIGCNLRSAGAARQSLGTRLLEENELRCRPPLTPEEVYRIVDSILSCEPGGKSLKTQWQESVLESCLPARGKLTLVALSMFADQDGRSCFPTQDQIAGRASSDPRTVRTHLKEAENKGWIKTYKRGRTEGPGYNYGYILQPIDRKELPN